MVDPTAGQELLLGVGSTLRIVAQFVILNCPTCAPPGSSTDPGSTSSTPVSGTPSASPCGRCCSSSSTSSPTTVVVAGVLGHHADAVDGTGYSVSRKHLPDRGSSPTPWSRCPWRPRSCPPLPSGRGGRPCRGSRLAQQRTLRSALAVVIPSPCCCRSSPATSLPADLGYGAAADVTDHYARRSRLFGGGLSRLR